MSHIVVVDYGMGNLRSVAKALEHVAPEQQIEVSGDPARVAAADRVVFPGQGAMPDCMREIDARGLRPALLEAARSKPFLGLCIGLQLLFEHSEEGDTPGLGILPGRVRRLAVEGRQAADGSRLKVPHMGWNEVHQRRAHPVWEGLDDGTRFYSSTVMWSNLRIRNCRWEVPPTRTRSAARWRRTACSRSSSTRKKVPMPASS